MPEEKTASRGVDRAGIVVSGVLGLMGLAVAVAPKSLITEEMRWPLFKLFIGLAVLVLAWGVYPYFRDLAKGARGRRKEAYDGETELAKNDDDAFREHMEDLAAARRAREQLPPVKAKPTAPPPPSPLKVPAAATSPNAPTTDRQPPAQRDLSPGPVEVTYEWSRAYSYALLNVDNRGAEATFWARLDVTGMMAIFPQGHVLARWNHTEQGKVVISRDHPLQLRVGRLDHNRESFAFSAMVRGGLPNPSTWCIPYSSNGKAGEARAMNPVGLGIGDSLVVKVTLLSDPPMRDGPIIRRVYLGETSASLLD